MAFTLTDDTQVGTIAELLPGATEVFRRAGISFCCGGAAPLAETVAHNKGNLPAIMAELQALIDRAAQVPPTETPALIDHILTRFHAVHREELQWLIPLAQKVETVHGDHEEAPHGLTAALIALQDDLNAHMEREEQVLFPMMKAGGHPVIDAPIAVMEADHLREEALLSDVLAAAHGLDLPEGACRSWTALYGGLAKFRDDLRAHMGLETGTLFPRFA